MASTTAPNRFIVWGANGWIGGLLIDMLKRQGYDVHPTAVYMQHQAEMCKVLDDIKPTHVIDCAGKTGRPNVDWCETHRLETIESNVIGTLMLAMECLKRDIHLTTLATGCRFHSAVLNEVVAAFVLMIAGIYSSTYNEDNTVLLSQPFTETDPANFGGSFYSYTKSRVEDMLKVYPNNLILRLRMPVSDDLHPRSFVTKIKSYTHVVNIPNSHSILTELLPMLVEMAKRRETGVYNSTNPGSISHNEVLERYRKIIDPKLEWQNFTLEEQNTSAVKAGRSNCELDSSKLMGKVKQYQGEGCEVVVHEIHEAYELCFQRMKENLQQQAGAHQKGVP